MESSSTVETFSESIRVDESSSVAAGGLDDDTPLGLILSQRSRASSTSAAGDARRPAGPGSGGGPTNGAQRHSDHSDEDEEGDNEANAAPLPLAAKIVPQRASALKVTSTGPGRKAAASMYVEVDDDEEDEDDEDEEEPESDGYSDDDKPLAKKRKVVAVKPVAPKKKLKASSSSSTLASSSTAHSTSTSVSAGSSTKKAAKPKPAKAASAPKTPVKKEMAAAAKKATPKKDGSPKKVKSDAEDEGEAVYKWWEDDERDSAIKWTTLQHNGVYFPPDYEPHGVKLKYDGKPVDLEPAAEEVASFYAAMLETDFAKNPVFQANFFNDFLDVLKSCKKPHPIKELSKCDFTLIAEHFARLKEQKKLMTKADKEKIKEEKKVIDDHYGWALLNGRKEKLGNFRIEPPGLFRGRGEHPKTGCLKTRVKPEQVTINIGKEAVVPPPPAGHSWGKVVHDNSVTWLAFWKENVNDNFKYVFLAANSSLKGQSDFKKFEKARELKKHAARIRQDYTAELKDKVTLNRQRATAMYLIDRLALRAGNEKGEDEADTVGCCSLRYEHITLEPPNKVVFDFLGKDSIRYYNVVEVEEQVFKNLRIFKKEPKKEGDPIFDRLSTSILNKYLSSCMEGLTAKVFRTYNASYTFQEELKKTPADATVNEKVLAYNRANREVAILCNHQRSVSKTHDTQIARIDDRIRAEKYIRKAIKADLIRADPKLKKKMPELLAEESDLDDDFIEAHEEVLRQKEIDKAIKKLEKANEERVEAGKKAIPIPERDKVPVPVKKESSDDVDKLLKKFAVVSARIQAHKLSKIEKDEGKTTALGTSKLNYIDPRISTAWCQKFGVPTDKIFNKTLKEKFRWAMDVDADWEF